MNSHSDPIQFSQVPSLGDTRVGTYRKENEPTVQQHKVLMRSGCKTRICVK